MENKNINMVAIGTKKANAQNLTCFIAFITSVILAIIIMAAACIMPAVVTTTEITCWISMTMEAVAIFLGFISYWIKANALSEV